MSVGPLRLTCLFFHLQSGYLSSCSSSNETGYIEALIFRINTFFQQHNIDATELFVNSRATI